MRIVVAEDHMLFRDALERLLVDAGHDVVGSCGDGPGLVRQARAAHPELIVADVRMPPSQRDEGLRAAREIRAAAPGTGVLLISHHLQVSYAIELLAGGARGVGYLLKQRVAEVERFLAALETICRGGTVIDPEVVAAMIHGLDAPGLTALQRELLVLIAEGRALSAIASDLAISEMETTSRVTAALADLAASAVDPTST
jgi:DNA-binding NarL/FixJ family response regulator